MSDQNKDSDPLQSLIAEFLAAEQRSESLDREQLLAQHPEHADSCAEQRFANGACWQQLVGGCKASRLELDRV